MVAYSWEVLIIDEYSYFMVYRKMNCVLVVYICMQQEVHTWCVVIRLTYIKPYLNRTVYT